MIPSFRVAGMVHFDMIVETSLAGELKSVFVPFGVLALGAFEILLQLCIVLDVCRSQSRARVAGEFILKKDIRFAK